jgi:hypothetical protein
LVDAGLAWGRSFAQTVVELLFASSSFDVRSSLGQTLTPLALLIDSVAAFKAFSF